MLVGCIISVTFEYKGLILDEADDIFLSAYLKLPHYHDTIFFLFRVKEVFPHTRGDSFRMTESGHFYLIVFAVNKREVKCKS